MRAPLLGLGGAAAGAAPAPSGTNTGTGPAADDAFLLARCSAVCGRFLRNAAVTPPFSRARASLCDTAWIGTVAAFSMFLRCQKQNDAITTVPSVTMMATHWYPLIPNSCSPCSQSWANSSPLSRMFFSSRRVASARSGLCWLAMLSSSLLDVEVLHAR